MLVIKYKITYVASVFHSQPEHISYIYISATAVLCHFTFISPLVKFFPLIFLLLPNDIILFVVELHKKDSLDNTTFFLRKNTF